tara:strand:+ start:828 stop:1169 length:342 start_codon:yes stop_codon:yes gene_type:complete
MILKREDLWEILNSFDTLVLYLGGLCEFKEHFTPSFTNLLSIILKEEEEMLNQDLDEDSASKKGKVKVKKKKKRMTMKGSQNIISNGGESQDIINSLDKADGKRYLQDFILKS